MLPGRFIALTAGSKVQFDLIATHLGRTFAAIYPSNVLMESARLQSLRPEQFCTWTGSVPPPDDFLCLYTLLFLYLQLTLHFSAFC